ncbi:hypothetical protein FVEN_g5036 [Fusarium venenatum]|uniref:Uncharacterized protein n=1 Tax=Fusarium venenatum TaxID=56646 RepID=A0A2L2T499_9HYPO|nr:uncharacterized protein FVRRES_06929 [Fusarium venenatum]KAG8357005.1 hypothetical protein FVEN_g5036 [Fusarium venenatum]KAH6993887.1 hypothetical protein EDB82DRAFT_575401 [Fusarium venenatum]CEI62493.1 unnamed protein product [Fusarium venenatum]
MKDLIETPSATADPQSSENVLSIPGPSTVTLSKSRSSWCCIDDNRLRNNLFAAVGFLELANAGDFAANVWNDVPVPIYAIVFMAIGGTSAFVLSICAFFDSRKAWRNIKFLKQQKKLLKAEETSLSRDVFVEITTRELRIEVINRWLMDLLMGGGAMLISTGTFMAIGGANPKVWLASNILSGYLGNAPIALFGLLSAIWAVMVVFKMTSHRAAARKELQGSPTLRVLKERCFNVQVFFILNGASNILGGVGSMLTAERWWGYVILIPVIISSIFCNIWWRHRVGYDRPYISTLPATNLEIITETIEATSQLRHGIQDGAGVNLEHIFGDSVTLQEVLELFVKHDLFEQLSLRLVANKHVRHLFVHAEVTSVQVSVDGILAVAEEYHATIMGISMTFLKKHGPRHLLHRERFLLEVLGTYLVEHKKREEVTVEK